MTRELTISVAHLAAAVALSWLVFTSLLPAVAAAAESPTVTVDEPVNVSTSTTADAEVTIDDGTLVITGTATDPDGISHLTVAREFEYHDGENDGRGTEIDRYYATPDASNGTFRHAVPLGTGTNEVNVSVVDGQDYPTQIDIVVDVDDEQPPTAKRLTASPAGEWIHLEGWVSDNVQVGAVRAGGQTIQTQVGQRDLDREAVRLDHRVPRPDNDTVVVTLVDQAGNSREVAVPIGGGRTTSTPTETPTATAAAPASTAAPAATPAPTAAPTGTSGATPPPVTTPTPTPDGGGASPVGLLGVVIVVGGGLLMLNAGGGW